MTALSTDIPASIAQHLSKLHVLSLAISDAEGPWAANCFYVYRPEFGDLIMLTDKATRHGKALAQNARVAGTITGQPHAVAEICGLQFVADAQEINDEAEKSDAFSAYCARHPFAKDAKSTLWRLKLLQLKLTDNSIAFGHKQHWPQAA